VRFPSRLVVAAVILGAVALSAAADPPAETPAGAPRQTRWLQLDAAGFRIIFQERDAAWAAEVAGIAPSVRERTTAYLDYDPDEPIPVVLYGATARANGFFTPFPPHIALFVAAPAGPWMGAATESWLEAVFVHELIHYLHLTRPIGLFGTASRLFGPLATAGSVLFLPGWALEGVTVSGETRLTSGGRGRNPYFETEWVAPILAGEMYSLDQAGFPAPYAPRGRIYSAGYIMTEYLLETYGEDAFLRLNREFQRRPIAGMRRAIRRTTGERADDFYAGMVAELEERSAWRHELPGGIAATPDDRAGWFLLGGVDGGVVALRRGPFDAGSIMFLPRGAAPHGQSSWYRLASVAPLDEYSVAVAADGHVAAVVAERTDLARVGAGGMVSYGELFLVFLPAADATSTAATTDAPDPGDRDGSFDEGPGASPSPGSLRRLTRDTRLYHPATDRTASFVVAAERRGPFSVLVEIPVPADPAEEATITPVYGDGETVISMPAVSPGGDRVAVVENRSGRQSIVLLAREITPSGPRYTEIARIGAETAAAGATIAAAAGESSRVVPFRPLFAADGRELWFVAHGKTPAGIFGDDREEPSRDDLIQLYRLALEDSGGTAAPEVVLTDQVGVFAGLPLGEGEIIYGTYRADGFAIRVGETGAGPDLAAGLGTGAPATVEPVRLAGGAPVPLPGAARLSFDLPRPVLWVPTVAVAGQNDGRTRFDLGAGMIAAGIRGRHRVSAFAAWNPADAEPSGELSWTWMPGATALSLSAIRDYEYLDGPGAPGSGDADETVIARSSLLTAAVERPLWYTETPIRYAALVARVAGEYEAWDYSSTVPSPREELTVAGAARLLRYRHAGSAQIYGGVGGDIATLLRYRPAILDRPVADLASRTTATALLGRPWGMVRVQPAIAMATSQTGAAMDNLPWRGGSFDPEGEDAIVTADHAWLGRTTVSIAAPPLDAAWRSFAVQTIGASMYLEQGADGEGSPDNHSLLGAELTAGFLFNIVPLQLTAGVVARLPHGTEAGNPALRYYLRLGGVAVDQVSTEPGPLAPGSLAPGRVRR
jgi:hypothetical protein